MVYVKHLLSFGNFWNAKKKLSDQSLRKTLETECLMSVLGIQHFTTHPWGN